MVLSILLILALALSLLAFPALYAIILTILVSTFGDTVFVHVVLFTVYTACFLCIFMRSTKKTLCLRDGKGNGDMFW